MVVRGVLTPPLLSGATTKKIFFYVFVFGKGGGNLRNVLLETKFV